MRLLRPTETLTDFTDIGRACSSDRSEVSAFMTWSNLRTRAWYGLDGGALSAFIEQISCQVVEGAQWPEKLSKKTFFQHHD